MSGRSRLTDPEAGNPNALQLRRSDAPPEWWQDYANRHFGTFDKPAWQGLLAESFGTRSHYYLDEDAGDGFTVSVFPIGPFSIGYVNFPVGGSLRGRALTQESLRQLAHSPVCDVLRVPMSAFAPQAQLDCPVAVVPETAIVDLAAWEPGRLSKSLRGNLRRAERVPLSIHAQVDDADAIYALYRSRVRHHRGRVRYNREYFRGLVTLARLCPEIKISGARSEDGKLIAFLVTVRHRATANYLHGGFDPEYSAALPSDRLLFRAIIDAQTQSLQIFNLMASPPAQRSLVRFKEKWGAITKPQLTYSARLRPLKGFALDTLERMWRLLAGARSVYRRSESG